MTVSKRELANRRPSQKAREEAARAQQVARDEARAKADLEMAAQLKTTGLLAARRLHRVIEEGMAEAAYVGALRLSLHAAGALVEKQEHSGITEVVIRFSDDAPGTLKKVPGGDDDG